MAEEDKIESNKKQTDAVKPVSVKAKNPNANVLLRFFLHGSLGFVLLISGMLVSVGYEDMNYGMMAVAGFMFIFSFLLYAHLIQRFRWAKGKRAYDFQLQLGPGSLILERYMIDTFLFKESITHKMLQPWQHEKHYYQFPFDEINSIRLSEYQDKAIAYITLHSLDLPRPWFIHIHFIKENGAEEVLRLFEILNIPIEIEMDFEDNYHYLRRYTTISPEY